MILLSLSSSSAVARSSRYVWLILLFAVAIFNFPFFLNAHFPLHDSLFFLQIFKYFYSSIFFSGEPPLWAPHTGYGVSFDYYRMEALGPFQYLVAGLGLLLRIQNVKALFFLSLSLDLYFIALGLYLVAREAGASTLAALAASVAVVGTLFPDMQLDFNYKLILPLPICMYLLLRFARGYDARFAVGCLASLTAFTFGTASYLVVVQFYILAVWIAGLILFDLPHQRLNDGLRVFRSTILHPVCLMLLAASAIGAIGLWHALHQTFLELQPMSPARDPKTAVVPLDQFLTYGGNTNGYKLLEMVTGLPIAGDFKFYAGGLCLAITAYALYVCRRTSVVWSALFMVVIALLFTMPVFSPVARLSYYLPGMDIVRHIGDFAILAKPALCILVAIGLTDIARHFDGEHRRALMQSCSGVAALSLAAAVLVGRNLWGNVVNWPLIDLVTLLCVGAACVAIVALSFGQRRPLAGLVAIGLVGALTLLLFLPSVTFDLSVDHFFRPFRSSFPWIWVSSIGILLLVCYALRWRTTFSATAFSIVIYFGAADIVIYRAQVLTASPSFNTRYERNAAIAEPLRWQPERTYDSEQAIVAEVFKEVVPGTSSYGFRSTYLNIDSCKLQRQDLLARGLVDFRLARETGKRLADLPPGAIDLSAIAATGFVIAGDETFARALGCNTPKLQIVSEPVSADGARAANLIKAQAKQSDSSDVPPLVDLNPVIDAGSTALEPAGPTKEAQATIVEFSPNRLVADISNPYPTDAWVVYLDAFIPRWRAETDGAATTIHPVNLGFKGILVSPGPHRIGFYLDDALTRLSSILLSIGLGLAGLLATIFCCVQSRRPDKVVEKEQPA